VNYTAEELTKLGRTAEVVNPDEVMEAAWEEQTVNDHDC
jgi:hypothetical protein